LGHYVANISEKRRFWLNPFLKLPLGGLWGAEQSLVIVLEMITAMYGMKIE
jgi:hypothetical protein